MGPPDLKRAARGFGRYSQSAAERRVRVDRGLQNLLTGCYCDYFFKGLLINKRTHWWLRTDQLTPYQEAWYVRFFKFDSPEMPED